MTLYELLDLNLSAGTRIDVQLSIFITVHLAIFGGIIYVDRPLREKEKITSLIIYTIFALLNYHIMKNQLDISKSLVSEIAKLAISSCCGDSEPAQYFAEQLKSGKYNIKDLSLIFGHLIFYLIVFLSILFDKSLAKMRENKIYNIKN
ncbi:hypothetical protein QFX18_17810 [Saccharophagus degradans]|uniref:hypothetical protein n=1 Tax=Saccharophagus degradans TaxID=86304 RepID=UPI002477FB04|nr:hypothetical protein [Saccharophagus degradans]WGO97868.1 hypothetical protein QFX18_17810 [Saccharophagus degradans]